MRLPTSAHTSQPWRIHALTRDFRVEDVWALPAAGGLEAFPRLVQLVASLNPAHGSSRAVRTLFGMRWKIGRLFHWDIPDLAGASGARTLRDRLPADLRDSRSVPDFGGLPFTTLYATANEFAAEIINRTVHGVMHLGWVPDPGCGYRGQMAVLVRPKGLPGLAYMAAIAPFRHQIVYPAMIREVGRKWRTSAQRAPFADESSWDSD